MSLHRVSPGRRVLILLISVAVAAGVLASARPGTTSAGPTINCTNPSMGPGASITFDPTSAAPGAELSVGLKTNEGTSGFDGQVEAFLGSGLADIQASTFVGEATLPAFSDMADIDGHVPSLAAGSYGAIVCWQVIPIEGPAFWKWNVVQGFEIAGTPVPTTATPTASPTVTPTRTPTPTPTPSAVPTPSPTRRRLFPERAPIVEGYQIPPGPPPDYSVFGIEVTQGIQCFDTSNGLSDCADNSLSLVTQKNSMARIYLQVSGGAIALAGVPVRLHMFAGGTEYVVNTYGTAHTSIRQDLNDSANVWFNVDVNNGIDVEFYAEVDPDNLSVETDNTNNRFPASGTLSIEFKKRPEVDVLGWRMRYHPSGFSGNQYATGWAVYTGGYQWLNDLWPVEEGGINYGIRSGYLDWTSPLLAEGDGPKVIARAKRDWLVQAITFWGIPLERVHVWTPRSNFVRGQSDPHFLNGAGVVSSGDNLADGSDTMDDPGFGVTNFVHEVSHNSEMHHTATGDACGLLTDNSPDASTDWPYTDPTIQEFGYNPDTGRIHNPSSTYDFMSYCADPWISPFHWQQQFDAEGASIAEVTLQSSPGPVIGIVAMLDNPAVGDDTGGDFETLYLAPAGNLVPPSAGNAYSVQLRAGETVLAQQSFDVSFVNTELNEPLAESLAAFSMAAPPGATSVVLLRGSEVLDTQPISAGSPTVTFTEPSSHQNWATGTTENISWTGSDPDGEALVYTVYYSKDGGTTFELLVSDVTETNYAVEVDSIAGAEDAVFRVLASDGVNTGYGDSATISVPNKPPFAGISGPEDGALAEAGGLVVLQGSALDLEDGALVDDEALEWSSDKDGVLGTGGSLPLNTLSPGEHVITLTATDSDGASSIDSRTLFVGVSAAVRFRPGVVSPANPQNLTAILTLPPGVPTTSIDEASLTLEVAGATLNPIATQQLGDTNGDGLPELAVTLSGQALLDAIPDPRVQTNVMLVGKMDDDTPLQGRGLLAEITPGDADCSGVTETPDAVLVLADIAQIRRVNCLFAVDMDCDTTVTPLDALAILASLANVSNGLTDGCAAPIPVGMLTRTSDGRDAGDAMSDRPVYFAAFLGIPALMGIGRRPGKRN